MRGPVCLVLLTATLGFAAEADVCQSHADCDDGVPCTIDECVFEAHRCRHCAPQKLHLDWRPTVVEDHAIEDIVDLDLFVTRAELSPAYTRGARVLLRWDPEVFQLLGAQGFEELCESGPIPSFCPTAHDWDVEAFGVESLNDDWGDGDAAYAVRVEANGPGAQILGARLWLGRFQFKILAVPTTFSFIEIPEALPACCRFEPGDRGHAQQCGGSDESCCVGLLKVDADACVALDGEVELTSTSVPWAGADGQWADTQDCNVAGDLGRVLYYPSPPCQGDEDTWTCGDVDGDRRSDDLCFHYKCNDGQCDAVERRFGDVANFYACGPDGSVDGGDRFSVANCFSDVDSNLPPPASYACEPGSPFAVNVDVGGPFGSCQPDGVCDGHDAFAVLRSFAATNTCRCQLDGPGVRTPSCK